MASKGWQLLARMPDRSIGGILSSTAFDLTLRYREVGSWSIDQPPERAPAGWPAPGCGVVFVRDGEVVASGTLDEQQFDWKSEGAGQGDWSLTGDTDLGRIGYHIIWPSPNQAWTNQTASHYELAAGFAEAQLRKIVHDQCGLGAIVQNRVPGILPGAGGVLGASVTVRERFAPMLETLRKTADAGGGLAFDVLDNLAGGFELNVWQPVDRTGQVLFAREAGNVTSLTPVRIAPTAGIALVAGGGELENRTLLQYTDPAYNPAYGPRFVFVDQRQVGADEGAGGTAPTPEQLAEYEKAALEALADGAEQTAISATVIDTPKVKWGRDYQLGDLVPVVVPWGKVTDLIREVQIKVDADGNEDISSSVGSTQTSAKDPMAAVVRDLLDRVSQLERSQ